MSARPWRVENRSTKGQQQPSQWSWRTSVATEEAGRTEVYRIRKAREVYQNNAWDYRLVNRDTSEVIEL